MDNILSLLPEALVQFLKANSGKTLHFDQEAMPRMEVTEVELFDTKDLRFVDFEVDISDYKSNHGVDKNLPQVAYNIQGIDLIKRTENYEPEGILAYFPQFKEFGSWDCDHQILTIFPNANWEQIEPALVKYINAQWYAGTVTTDLLQPWSDHRCSHLIPIDKSLEIPSIRIGAFLSLWEEREAHSNREDIEKFVQVVMDQRRATHTEEISLYHVHAAILADPACKRQLYDLAMTAWS